MPSEPESTAARILVRLARLVRKAFIRVTAFAPSSPRTCVTSLRTWGTYLSVLWRAAASSAWNNPGWRPVASQTRVSARSTGSVSSSPVTPGVIVVITVL